ncbi:tape measure protein, partial [Moraxella boevrei]|uniref:tape measure protein n=1 Tax=Faucicola boevrei TaxID=346665 RepID=UPI003736EC55
MTEQTSRLSIVVDTTNAQQRLAQFRQSLRQTSDSSNLAGRGVQNLSVQTGQLSTRFIDANGRLREANGRFASIAQNAMLASRGVNGLANSTNRLINPLSRINDLLSRTQAIISGGLFGIFALSVAKTADTMQDLNSQIMLVTKNEQEQLVVKERLHQMANKNLTDLKSTIGLYTNSARALGNMGKSQEEVLKFTNAVSLAMGVGGKSATEQASALLQLGQAMQSGVLQGDEFRSLAENAPIMLDLIAEKLGKTRGQVRKMAGEGKITAQVVYDSLSGATDKLQAMFDKMPVTMSQAFGVVKNNYNVFVDNFINKTTGLSGAVAKGLIGISNHFETIAKVAIAGTGLALVGLASKVTLTTLLGFCPCSSMSFIISNLNSGVYVLRTFVMRL